MDKLAKLHKIRDNALMRYWKLSDLALTGQSTSAQRTRAWNVYLKACDRLSEYTTKRLDSRHVH
jgi:hypothetical protein